MSVLHHKEGLRRTGCGAGCGRAKTLRTILSLLRVESYRICSSLSAACFSWSPAAISDQRSVCADGRNDLVAVNSKGRCGGAWEARWCH